MLAFCISVSFCWLAAVNLAWAACKANCLFACILASANLRASCFIASICWFWEAKIDCFLCKFSFSMSETVLCSSNPPIKPERAKKALLLPSCSCFTCSCSVVNNCVWLFITSIQGWTASRNFAFISSSFVGE